MHEFGVGGGLSVERGYWLRREVLALLLIAEWMRRGVGR